MGIDQRATLRFAWETRRVRGLPDMRYN